MAKSISGLCEGSLIHLDEQRFQQILLNYLSNALKFTSRGKVDIDVIIVPPGSQSRNQPTSEYSSWYKKIEHFDDGLGIMKSHARSESSSSSESSDNESMSPFKQRKFLDHHQSLIEGIF